MDERDKEVIRRCYVRLEKNLEASAHLSHLYQDNVLSEEDMDKIKAKSSTKKKAAKLLKILQRRKNGLHMLIKALLLAKVQDFLAYELLEVVTWTEEEIQNFHKEVEGKLDRYQILEMEMASLQESYNELEQKHKQLQQKHDQLQHEYNQTLKDLNDKKVHNLQHQIDDREERSPHRGGVGRSSMFSRLTGAIRGKLESTERQERYRKDTREDWDNSQATV